MYYKSSCKIKHAICRVLGLGIVVLLLQSNVSAADVADNKKSEAVESKVSKTESEKGDDIKKKKYSNINRLQYRKSFKADNNTFSQTTNIMFPNEFFLFDHFEYVDNGYYFLEIYTGKPFSEDHPWGKSFGWVARTEVERAAKTVYSLGTIWYISSTPKINEVLKKIKFKTFLEVFFIKSDDDKGTTDIFHHYTFPVFKKLYMRGYNRILFDTNQGRLFYAVQDLIYSLFDNIDVYMRHDYQNKDGFQNKEKGSAFYMGMRYNFSF